MAKLADLVTFGLQGTDREQRAFVIAADVFRECIRDHPRVVELFKLSAPEFIDAADRLVREWQLPFPWVIMLREMFDRGPWHAGDSSYPIAGVVCPGYAQPRHYMNIRSAVPKIDERFETRDDESPDDALRRWKALSDDVEARLMKARGDWRRGVVVDAQKLRRDVEWFYRSRIKSPPDTKYRLARESGVADKVVRVGSERAAKLLREVPITIIASRLPVNDPIDVCP